MGAVAMEERSTGLVDRGYPVSEATLYIYCDACGSFNIKIYIPLIKILIIAAILSAGIFLASADKSRWVCLLPLILFGLMIPWKDLLLNYKCRKCGYSHILAFNSLHYKPFDLSVLDVPEYQAQKRYLDTDVLHFDQFT